MTLKEVLDFQVLSFGNTVINVYNIVGVVLILLIARLLIYAIKRLFKKRIADGKFDKGRGLALYQIARYVIILAAIIIAIDSVGISIKLLLAGSAALLVGVGLGLQQTFNDLISGVILLFEGSVTIGDIIEVNGMIAKVKNIRIRVSEIETREGISILVPNSKLTNDNVINWSHNRANTRFSLKVGVAYGSNVELVSEILEAVTTAHPDISKQFTPRVRFIDFGDSALQFEVIYWSDKLFMIEQIKSDLRFEIDKEFRKHGVVIPFPQRDLHLKSTVKGL